jgi:hypothetical protein
MRNTLNVYDTKIRFIKVRPFIKCRTHTFTFWKIKRMIRFSRHVHLSSTEEARIFAVVTHPLLPLAQILLRWLLSTHFRYFPNNYSLQIVQSSGIWYRVAWHSLRTFGWTCCLPIRGIHVTYVTSPEILTESLKYEQKLKLNRIIATSNGCEFNVSLGRWTDSGSCRALSLVKNFFPPFVPYTSTSLLAPNDSGLIKYSQLCPLVSCYLVSYKNKNRLRMLSVTECDKKY